jgi:peptidoglycan/xylan/chitin deacetylase (PgdA/CDA1 family)
VAKARPGSIIDLHDGLDGKVDADRTVLVAALPAILDGLAAKGLQPVRLDELLGRPGYLDAC